MQTPQLWQLLASIYYSTAVFAFDTRVSGLQVDAEEAAMNAIHWLQSCNAYVVLASGGVRSACHVFLFCSVLHIMPLDLVIDSACTMMRCPPFARPFVGTPFAFDMQSWNDCFWV